jgi:hypothetical protein
MNREKSDPNEIKNYTQNTAWFLITFTARIKNTQQ